MHAGDHHASVAGTKQTYRPVGRPLAVLRLLAENPGLGPKLLGVRLGVPTSYVGPILTSLQRRGCIMRRARGRYEVTELGTDLVSESSQADQEDPSE